MKRTIAFLIFPGAQSLDISGPMDVFAEANRFLLPENHYQLDVIGVERGLLSCSNGLLIQAHRHFSEVNDAYDLLLVVGGPALAQQEMNQDVYDWLRLSSQRARRFGSICNGAFILARAGLLNGRVSLRIGIMLQRLPACFLRRE